MKTEIRTVKITDPVDGREFVVDLNTLPQPYNSAPELLDTLGALLPLAEDILDIFISVPGTIRDICERIERAKVVVARAENVEESPR